MRWHFLPVAAIASMLGACSLPSGETILYDGIDVGDDGVAVDAADGDAVDAMHADVLDAGMDVACTDGGTSCSGSCIDLRVDPMNCGRCGHACDPTAPVCVAGSCMSCGAPGQPCCTSGAATCGGGASCTAGTCMCPSGRSQCGVVCADLQTDTNNCGTCGTTCPSPTGGNASCTAGVCGRTCPAGQHVCGSGAGACFDDTDPNHCGATCSSCASIPFATPTCDGTQCGEQCNSGYTLCGSACVNIHGTDTSNCGACGRMCSTSGVASLSCNGGLCNSSCSAGRSNCNQPSSGADDGCECATPACCGSSCQTRHDDGAGDVWYDCTPGYTQSEAMTACLTWQAHHPGFASCTCQASAGCPGTGVWCNGTGYYCGEWDFGSCFGGMPGNALVATSTSCASSSITMGTWH